MTSRRFPRPPRGRGRSANQTPAALSVIRTSDDHTTALEQPGTNTATSTVLTAFSGGMAQRPPAEDETVTLRSTTTRTGTRRAALVVLSGPDEGQIYKLKADGVLVVGRGSDADVRLTDHGVSRHHARVSVQAGGHLLIEDLDSHNGTFVGTERIKSRSVVPEELVRMGVGTVLKFCLIDAVEEQYRRRMIAAALRDPLTGVYNRRHFDERLISECSVARRHSRPLTLMILDIDDFKAINDERGHPVGDVVLKAVSTSFQETIRRDDLLFRYGGEEFAVLMRETSLEGTLRLAERLRRRVAKTRYDTVVQGATLSVTVSIGVAVFWPDMSETDLVARADEALLRAKREGKNRVIAAD